MCSLHGTRSADAVAHLILATVGIRCRAEAPEWSGTAVRKGSSKITGLNSSKGMQIGYAQAAATCSLHGTQFAGIAGPRGLAAMAWQETWEVEEEDH